MKYYGSYFKNTDLWVDINDFHFIFLQWMKWINAILKKWRSYYRGLDECYSILSIPSLSLCTCVFFHMRSLTVGVGNWSWVSQSEQQKCNIQSWKYNNYIELLGVLVCIITFSSLFWMMCQLLKYNKTIIKISISFFLTRLLWNSVVQDQCQI